VVEVAGVVEGVEESTWDEFKVEAEARCFKPLPLCPTVPLLCLSPDLDMRLLLLPRFLRKEGIVSVYYSAGITVRIMES